MKNLITIILLTCFAGMIAAQNAFRYPVTVGNTTSGINGQITLFGGTSGSVVLKSNVVAGTGTIFQFPANNGTNGTDYQSDGLHLNAAGDTMQFFARKIWKDTIDTNSETFLRVAGLTRAAHTVRITKNNNVATDIKYLSLYK